MREQHPTHARLGRAAIGLSLALLLAACGGGGGNTGTPEQPPAPPVTPVDPPAPPPTPAPVSKALLIGVDGVQYEALQQALAATRMPTLQGLGTLLPAYTGGVMGRATQQQATAGPGWATLLTGTWADRHEIRSNYEGQAFSADTVFKQLKAVQAGARTATIASWGGLPQLLRADRAAGYLDLAKDCAGDDACVGSETSAAIASGDYALVVADFQGPAQVADIAGYGSDYQNALATLDRRLAAVRATLASRRQAHPEEDWLVIVAGTHGLGATGVADGIPVPSNLATFVGLDRPANLALTAPTTLPTAITPWYAYAAATDIAPTLLTHLSARPAAKAYAIDGSPLVGPSAVRQLQAATNEARSGVVLGWTLPTPPASVTVLRDGEVLATLPADATRYEDTAMKPAASGFYTYNYTVVAGSVPTSLRATLDYKKPEPPIELLASLRDGLTHLFALQGTLADGIDAGTVFTPWVTAAAPVYTAAGDAPFKGTGRALASTNYAGPTVCASCDGGLRIPTAKVTSTSTSFSFGFWFRSDATRSGMPIVSNKDWGSGSNPGIALGQYGSAIRFNIGKGGARLGDKDLNFSANTWVYAAMTVDIPTLKATYYVFDPVLGMQSSSGTLTADYVAALNGLNKGFSLNEDGDGGYGPNYRNGNASNTIGGRFDYSEFGSWNRALTPAEITSIARSGKSITTLLP